MSIGNSWMSTNRLAFTLLALVLSLFVLPLQASADTYVWPSWRAAAADGTEFHSRQLDGNVAVIAVWASWCPSCRKQIPILNGLQQYYQAQEVQVLGFSFDHSDEIHQSFVKKTGFEFPSIFARNGEGLKVIKMLQTGAGGTLEAVPTVLIYDKRGQLVHRMVGLFHRKQLEDLIEPLLAEDYP